MKTNKFLSAAFVVALGLISASGFAQSNFDATHPRRAQVNSRLQNQNARVDNKVADGKMSKAEGAKIHAQDHAIRKEEEEMLLLTADTLQKPNKHTSTTRKTA